MTTELTESLISKFIINNMHMLGFWPKPSSTPRYWIYSYIFNTFLSTLLISLVIKLILLDDIEEITDSLVSTLTVAAYFAKSLNFYYHRDNMRKCFSDLSTFQHNNFEEITLTTSKHKLLNIFGFTYFIGGYLTIFALCFIPFSQVEPVYPLPTWYPFEKENRFYYGIAYAHQIVLITLILTINVSFDFYSYYLMGMVAVQIQVINMRLENLGSDCGRTESGSTYSKLIKQSIQELHDCIRAHQCVVSLAADIGDIFSFSFFFQISMSGLVICGIIYQLTTVIHEFVFEYLLNHDYSEVSPLEDAFRFLYNFCCIGLITLQIFLLCYFGNDVLHSSELLINGVYSSKWYCLSPAYRKDLLIFMERLKRNVQIVAGKIFPMNLMLFSTVLNFAWRLYTLLRDSS